MWEDLKKKGGWDCGGRVKRDRRRLFFEKGTNRAAMIWGRNARVGWKEEEEDPEEEKLRDGEKRREKEGRRK